MKIFIEHSAEQSIHLTATAIQSSILVCDRQGTRIGKGAVRIVVNKAWEVPAPQCRYATSAASASRISNNFPNLIVKPSLLTILSRSKDWSEKGNIISSQESSTLLWLRICPSRGFSTSITGCETQYATAMFSRGRPRTDISSLVKGKSSAITFRDHPMRTPAGRLMSWEMLLLLKSIGLRFENKASQRTSLCPLL